VPSMGVDRRCKSSGELVAATHTNRKATSRETGPAVRPAPKEAGSETASRRTGSTRSEQHRVWRIEAFCAQGERTYDREALATKGPERKSDGCAGKSTHPYLGRSRLVPERVTPTIGGARSQQRP
jgi:hypothetical protein